MYNVYVYIYLLFSNCRYSTLMDMNTNMMQSRSKSKDKCNKKNFKKPNSYFCPHCKKNLSYKTYLRHMKLYFKDDKSRKRIITLQLPVLSSDSDIEQSMCSNNYIISVMYIAIASYVAIIIANVYYAIS